MSTGYTESCTKMLSEFYSVVLVEELPNRNCFGINLVMFLCVMVPLTQKHALNQSMLDDIVSGHQIFEPQSLTSALLSADLLGGLRPWKTAN